MLLLALTMMMTDVSLVSISRYFGTALVSLSRRQEKELYISFKSGVKHVIATPTQLGSII
jgi:hypothetical protein